MECTGESPQNVTVNIQCGDNTIFNKLYLVNYNIPMNITGNIIAPQNQQCNLSIVFINTVGFSDSLIFTLSKLHQYIILVLMYIIDRYI